VVFVEYCLSRLQSVSCHLVRLNINTYLSISVQNSEEISALLLIADPIFAAIVMVPTRVATGKHSHQCMRLLVSSNYRVHFGNDIEQKFW
jgi:hypothetical protein